MAAPERAPEPTELVYVPQPSWLPLFTATGVAVVVVGLFAGWIYSLFGAALAIPSIWTWIKRTREEIDRLPREQRLTTAVLPAIPIRRPPR